MNAVESAIAGAAIFCLVALGTFRPLFRQPAVPSISLGVESGVRFGMDRALRIELFDDFARGETTRIRFSRRLFRDDWSIQDHRTDQERNVVAALAAEHGLTRQQVYAAIEEGINRRWPGPDGVPLQATAAPVSPRRR